MRSQRMLRQQTDMLPEMVWRDLDYFSLTAEKVCSSP